MKPELHTGRNSPDRSHYHYWNLVWMVSLSFAAMYGLMYAMVDQFDNVYVNFNQAYMAALMTLPMVPIEMVVMRSMYVDRRLNLWILVACAVGGVALWVAIREQAAIDESQFLRSMIPHHAGAILMCEQAGLTGAAEIKLCRQIVESQKVEIAEMKTLLGDR